MKEFFPAILWGVFFGVFSQIPDANGQNDSTSVNAIDHFSVDRNMMERLPVMHIRDLYELEPSLCRLNALGTYFSDGFAITDDFNWLDGVPVKFADDLPLRVLGSVEFHPYTSYLSSNNSLSGLCSLHSLEPADSLFTMADGNFSLIDGRVNDLDLQVLVSGPIRFGNPSVKQKVKLGYEVASRIFSSTDTYPSCILKDQVTGEYAEYLENNPLRPAGMGYGTFENAEFTRAADASSLGADPGSGKEGFSLHAKLKLDLPKEFSISIGSYDVNKKERVPVYDNYFFNPDGNPEKKSFYTNNYLKFSGQQELGNGCGIRYQIQGSFSVLKDETSDPDHGSDLFNYGYVGSFDSYKRPTFEIGSATIDGTYYPELWVLNSWDYSDWVDFTPGSVNPLAAGYTSSYFSIYEVEPEGHLDNLDQIQIGGGILNGMMPDQVYGLWNNIGTVYNCFSKNDERRMRVLADGEYEFGQNLLQFGLQYDRSSYSNYSLNPVALWSLLRSATNFHIRELDLDHPVLHPGGELDSVYYYRQYAQEVQYSSDRRLRELLGLDPEGIDFIETDSYNHDNHTISYYDREGTRQTLYLSDDLLSMGLFTPEDLVWATDLKYSGFDYTGNLNRHPVDFNDFFASDNDSGEKSMEVGSYDRQVFNGYINYHTGRKRWALDAGARLDIFNSGQKILRDPTFLNLAHPETGELTLDDFTPSPLCFNVLPQFDVRFLPLKSMMISLSYHSALRYPDPEQIFSNPAVYYFFYEGLPGNILPNGELRPVRSDQGRLGLKYFPMREFIISGDVFGYCYTGLIGKVYHPEAVRAYVTFENSDEAVLSYGLDLGVEHRPFRSSGITYGATYHLLLTNNEEFKNSASFHLPKHVIKGHLNYNTGYDSGYRGPSGKIAYSIFESLGASLMVHYHAGIGYSGSYQFNEFNGELPQTLLFDFKVEKGFHFKNSRSYLGLYCIIQNLLDSKVIYEVYPTTGQPDDDGFLTAPENQVMISQALDEESFRYLYSQYINTPANYGLPRCVSIGLSLQWE